jgi:hypothetical protein
MPAMRVSLVARFVSHPSIDFGTRRASAHRSRLGLDRSRTVYHRPRRRGAALASVTALRAQTSKFRFPSVARPGAVPVRRAAPRYGTSRARHP